MDSRDLLYSVSGLLPGSNEPLKGYDILVDIWELVSSQLYHRLINLNSLGLGAFSNS